jgi:hypothetical protein
MPITSHLTVSTVDTDSLKKQNFKGLFPGVKKPGREADHSPPSSDGVELVELYLHSPNTPSWRGAQLKHRTTL